jgi:hypothetical protein
MGPLGLAVPLSVTDSLDKTALQMWALANKVGEELMNAEDWQVLSKDMIITTDGVTKIYPLPEDFDHFIQDSSWNQTTRLPMLGSLSEPEWQQLKARNLGGTTFAMLFRVTNDNLELYDPGSSPQTLVLPYMGRGWVRNAANELKDVLEFNDDRILFDPALFKAALKLAFMIAKGFDAMAAKFEYDKALAAAAGKQAPARTLSLGQPHYPYLGENNLPYTGYGIV